MKVYLFGLHMHISVLVSKVSILTEINPIANVHMYFKISRSVAANISVLASPRMIPICIVCRLPLGLNAASLAASSVQQ